MKTTKLQNIILCLLTVWGVTACSDSFDKEEWKASLEVHYLTADQTSFSSTQPDAFTNYFTVNCINMPWQFTSVPSWVHLTPNSGSTNNDVTLNVEENTTTKERTAIFYLSPAQSNTSVSSKAMSVSQGEAAPTLTLDNSNITFSGAASSATCTVTANCSWSVSKSASWLTLEATTNVLKISAEENLTGGYRTGTITVRYGTYGSTSITVKQSPANVTASAASIAFENPASTFTMQVTSEVSWTAVASDSWINVKPDNGTAGTTDVVVEVTPNTGTNARSGSVSILTGTLTCSQISITQQGLILSWGVSSMSFTSGEIAQKVQVKSNTNWTVLSKPNWITLDATEGYGNQELTVTASDNGSMLSRQGEIVLQVPGLTLQTTLKVSQKGKTFSADATLLEFDASSSQQRLTITTDASWASSTEDAWISSTPASGQGNASIWVSVTENNSAAERTGAIRYSYANSHSDVTVHQAAKYLTIDNATFNFTSKGGTHVVELMTNERWTASVEQDAAWISLSQTSGEGQGKITLTVQDNPSVNPRSAAVVITPEYAQSVRILVSQQPRQLKVDVATIMLFAKGGTSNPITVETDGTYEISTSDSWFTITESSSDHTFTVSAPAYNEPEARRGTIHIALTDLIDGALALDVPVVQAGEGGSFILTPYEQEGDWNISHRDSLSLVITKYATDVNWNQMGQYTVGIQVEGYTTEYDWNAQDSLANHVTITPYGTETVWDNVTSQSGGTQVTITIYGSDTAWDGDTALSGKDSITLTPYGPDAIWGGGSHVLMKDSILFTTYGQDVVWGADSNKTSGDSITISSYGSDSAWGNDTNKNGGTITITPYNPEISWGNDANKNGGTISITPYTPETEWGTDANKNGGTISITPYTPESEWGTDSNKNGGTISVTPYGTDSIWGTDSHKNGGTITVTPYNQDAVWGTESNSSGTIQTSTYPTDGDWNAPKTPSSGTITTTPYAGDSDWGTTQTE